MNSSYKGDRPDGFEAKRADAAARDEAWRKLTPEQQLASLNGRLGPGKGAVKQRARIQKLIDARQAPPVEKTVPTGAERFKAKVEQAKRPAK